MADNPDKPAQSPSFIEELTKCWHQLPNKAIFFVLLAAWLLLFQFLGNATFGYVDTASLFGWMNNAYTQGDRSDEHGLLIPFVVLALFWWKRKELLELPNRLWWPALFVLLSALLLHMVGYLVQQPLISIVALFTGIYAITGLAWGPGWLRKSFFPFFLFAFCLPMSSHAEAITFPMRILVSKLVTVVSPVLGIDVLREGTQLFNSQHTYKYEVAAACSGLRSVTAIFCIATIYSFVAFKPHWKRALLILLAFPLAIVSNVFRMMCIVIAAELSGQGAGNFVHENWFFSLVPYIPAILGVMLVGHWLRNEQAQDTPFLEAKPV